MQSVGMGFPVFHAGDVLLFRGQGPLSWAIALATNRPSQWIERIAPSHVGICFEHEGRVLLSESTTLCDLPCEITGKRVRGVQAHDPACRINAYRGRVWRMRPSTPLSSWQNEQLSRFCLSQIGTPYDLDGLLRTGLLDHLVSFLQPPKHATVCSRFVVRAAREAALVGRNIVPDAYSPARIAREWVHEELFQWPEPVN